MAATNKSSRLLLKIIIVGSSGVGKSSLLERYVNGRFRDERQCTIGTDFLTKKVDCEGREVVVQLWDTAGLERFHLSALGASFYRGADGCVLVYDAKNRNSFDSLIHWRDEVLSKISTDHPMPIVVVANKIDLISEPLPQRKSVGEQAAGKENILDDTTHDGAIIPDDILDWCRGHGFGHMTASAKSDIGVHASMMAIISMAMAYENSMQREPKKQNSASNSSPSIEEIVLGDQYTKKSGPCSCL